MYLCLEHLIKKGITPSGDSEIELCEICEKENDHSHIYKTCYNTNKSDGCAYDDSPKMNPIIHPDINSKSHEEFTK